MSDADHLLTAMKDCQQILAAFIGIPDPECEGPLHEYDASKRLLVLVNRDEVPEILWRSAVMALDLMSIGVGFSEGDAPADESFEEQVSQLLKRGGS